MKNWTYNGIELENPPEDCYGFLYAIYADGKVYYGKKAFTHTRTRVISEKRRKLTKTRKKKEKVISDSQWRNYYGSCKPLLTWISENGVDNVDRIVLGFAKTRMDLTYWEMVLLVREEVLFRDDIWNSNILSKFFKGKINKLI